MLTTSDGSYQKGNWSNDKLRGVVFGRLKHKDSSSTKKTKFSIDLSEKKPKMRIPRNRQTNQSVNYSNLQNFPNHQTFDSISKKPGFISPYDST